jgi:hypothetical protein
MFRRFLSNTQSPRLLVSLCSVRPSLLPSEQTAPSPSGVPPGSRLDYTHRRQLARELWIPRARRYRHIAIKFIVGVNPDPVKHARMLDEQEKYGDILVLPVNGQ